MGLFEQFPYTNFHELNLNWILKEVKTAVAQWKVVRGEFADITKEFSELENYVANYFNTLDLNEEVKNAIDQMIDDGTLSGLISTALTGIVNVKSFGAVGDGVADDTRSFKDALDFADGNVVYIPEGTYNLGNGEFSGTVNLQGVGTLVNFTYKDLTFPNIEGNHPSATTPYLTLNGLTFKGDNGYGLNIIANAGTGVHRNFRVADCKFIGENGALVDNCYHSEFIGCEFIHTAKAIELRSCTNMLIDGCQFFSPIIGVNLISSANDTANRKGGENCKIISCTFIDGVTGINAHLHNYLWVVDCMIDYFNNGINLNGSRYVHFTNSYIGANKVPKASRFGYIAPASYNGIQLDSDPIADYQSSVNIAESEIVMYNSGNNDNGHCVGGTDGTLPITEFVANNSRFTLETGCTADSLIALKKCYGITIADNVFTSVNNETVTKVFTFAEYAPGRVNIGYNDFANCFNGSTAILPQTGNQGKYTVESGKLTFTGTGEAPVMELAYPVQNVYKTQPTFTYAITKCGNYANTRASISAYDSNNIVVKLEAINGTPFTTDEQIEISIVVCGLA